MNHLKAAELNLRSQQNLTWQPSKSPLHLELFETLAAIHLNPHEVGSQVSENGYVHVGHPSDALLRDFQPQMNLRRTVKSSRLSEKELAFVHGGCWRKDTCIARRLEHRLVRCSATEGPLSSYWTFRERIRGHGMIKFWSSRSNSYLVTSSRRTPVQEIRHLGKANSPTALRRVGLRHLEGSMW